VELTFSSEGGRFTFPEERGWPEDDRAEVEPALVPSRGGRAAVVSLPAGAEGALAVGAGSGVVMDRVAGDDSTGISIVVGAVSIGACCCAVGWVMTGGRPL
jgi:hypothetical protein